MKITITFCFHFRGIYLSFPEEMKPTSWPAKDFYLKLATNCFVIDPNQRTSFTNLIHMIEQELKPQEKVKYLALTTHYHQKDTKRCNEIDGRFMEESIASITDFKDVRKTNFPTTNGYSRFPGMSP